VQVFLIRHAEAIDETLELRDPHRHLTTHGRAQARALGERLRWHDCTPTQVWASPLVRTVQTAELVLATLGTELLVTSEPALAPGEDVRPLVQRLEKLPADAVAVIVGHEPILSGLGALLTGDRKSTV
jgi:phosphohistidine phosphatase